MARAVGTRARFAVAYLLLGAAVGGGLGAFAVLVKRPGPQPPPAWSSWRPSASGRSQLLEIADHVGSGYLLPSGNELTAIKVGGVPGAPTLKAIGIPKTAKPKTLADFKLYKQEKNAIYILCGLGSNCHLPDGIPSQSRGPVLRREALELALYTLEYAHPIDNVLVFFPPAPGENKLTSTLFFHRSDLESSLHHPLRRTLPQAQPLLPGKIAPGEKRTVEDLTKTALYRFISIANGRGYGHVVVVQPT